MKKKLISLLLCAVMVAAMLPVSVFASDEIISLVSCSEGKISIKLAQTASQLIAASYESGRAAGCSVRNDCTPGEYTFNLPENYTYKVFALGDKNEPLCKALEIKDQSAVLIREETNVALPTLDDSVATALGASLAEYAEMSLSLQKIQELFGTEETFAKIKDDPDLYMQYNRQISETLEMLQDVMPSLTALDAVTQKQKEEISANLAMQPSVGLSLQSDPDEIISWAQELSDQFDAFEGNNRIQQLAKNMGCDAKTAYSALSVAQSVLFDEYNGQADSYENWENAMIAIKAASKVSFYVCAAAATAGASTIAGVPAALATGTVSAGEAAGILVGAADVGLELGVDTAKIVLGSSSKAVQHLEDKTQPLSDALLLYSFFSMNNNADKIAFLGDLSQRIKGVYDSITIEKDGEGNPSANITSIDNRDPDGAFAVAEEKDVPSGKDKLDDDIDTPVTKFKNEHEKTTQELEELLEEEEIIEDEDDFVKRNSDYNKKVLPKTPDSTNPEGIEETYDKETGELISVISYDSNGDRNWAHYYDKGVIKSSAVYKTSADGETTAAWTWYMQDPDTGKYTNQIEMIEKRITSVYPEKIVDKLSYNENGTIAEHFYLDGSGNWHDEQYDGNGCKSVFTVTYPDKISRESYFTTDDPNVPGVSRIGELQAKEEWLNNDSLVPEYTLKETWEARVRENAGYYEYGWYHTKWAQGSSELESDFTLVYKRLIDEE